MFFFNTALLDLCRYFPIFPQHKSNGFRIKKFILGDKSRQIHILFCPVIQSYNKPLRFPVKIKINRKLFQQCINGFDGAIIKSKGNDTVPPVKSHILKKPLGLCLIEFFRIQRDYTPCQLPEVGIKYVYIIIICLFWVLHNFLLTRFPHPPQCKSHLADSNLSAAYSTRDTLPC